jgi:predicted O-methyltransferase YrrM
MHVLLEEIFRTKEYTTTSNEVVPINSETSQVQCEFLQELILANGYNRSIEIGFAYGMSALAIAEAISKNGGSHLVIDKFEHSHWQGAGLDLLKRAGYEVEFHEHFCYTVLPKLLEQGRRFDFAYIDSTKQMDWLLVDFFFLDKLLEVNGMIVFDDVMFPGIRKLVRYISQFPNYIVEKAFPENYKPSASRQLSSLLRFIPASRKLIKSEIVRSDHSMGINTSVIALRKIGEDTRNWDWHKDF